MTKAELVQKIKKLLEVSSDKSLLKGVYFNPLYADTFAQKVPELKQANFKFSKTETEDAHGTHVTSRIHGPNEISLSLGSVLLDGKSVLIQKSLATKESFINFFNENLPEVIR